MSISLRDSVPIDNRKQKSDTVKLSENTIFTLLSVRRRRELLRMLKQAGGEMTIADITDEITDREHGIDSNAAKRKAIYVSLHQTHIPRFVEARVFERDEADQTIRLTGPWKQLYAYLEFDPLLNKQGLLSRIF